MLEGDVSNCGFVIDCGCYASTDGPLDRDYSRVTQIVLMATNKGHQDGFEGCIQFFILYFRKYFLRKYFEVLSKYSTSKEEVVS